MIVSAALALASAFCAWGWIGKSRPAASPASSTISQTSRNAPTATRCAEKIDQPGLDQFGRLLFFDHGEIPRFEYFHFEITILALGKSSGGTQDFLKDISQRPVFMGQQDNLSYEFGRFRLNVAERVLLREGDVVPLTPKVFDILLTLVENSGQVVSKDDLMKRVWPNTFVEEGNLTQNISLLRKALGESPGGVQFIETVPRRGYRFVAEINHATAGNNGNASRCACCYH